MVHKNCTADYPILVFDFDRYCYWIREIVLNYIHKSHSSKHREECKDNHPTCSSKQRCRNPGITYSGDICFLPEVIPCSPENQTSIVVVVWCLGHFGTTSSSHFCCINGLKIQKKLQVCVDIIFKIKKAINEVVTLFCVYLHPK